MGRCVTAGKQLTMSDAEREAFVVTRRADSIPFRQIAEEVGLSHGQVHNIFKAACAKVPSEAVHTLRVQSSELADRAIADLLTIAENVQVSPRTRAEAWTSIRGWSESLRKLHGADAPSRSQVSVVSQDTIEAEIARLTAEMAAADVQLPVAAA
jgi:hypothetical protein